VTCEWFLYVVIIGSIYTRLCEYKFSISILRIFWFPIDYGHPSSLACTNQFSFVNFVVVPYVIGYCKKLWNYINYSSWNDTLLYYSVVVSTTCLFHIQNIDPLHNLKVAVVTPFRARWVTMVLIISKVKCNYLINQSTLTSKRIFHISHLSIRWSISL